MVKPQPVLLERSAIYRRVSTFEQTKGVSLEEQEADCRSYIGLYKLPVDIAVYTDIETGTTIDRSDLTRLLADARAGKFSHVVCYSIDRAARSVADFLEIEKKLARAHVQRVYVRERFDTSTPTGKFTATIMAAVAELEHETIKSRTRMGREGKVVKKGQLWSAQRTTRYGYHYYPPEERVTLPEGTCDANGWGVVEHEAAVVRRIFTDAASGISLSTLAAALTYEAVPTRRGMGPWRHNVLARMIKSDWYIGKATWGETVRVHVEDDSGTIRTAVQKRAGGPLREVSVPAIVTPELALAARNRVAQNRRLSHGNTKHEYLLRGLVYCGICEREGNQRQDGSPRSMSPRCKNAWRAYYCSSHGKDGLRRQHGVAAEPLEQALWADLSELLRNHETLFADEQALSDAAAQQARLLALDVAVLEGEIARLSAKIDGLMEYVGVWPREQIEAKAHTWRKQQQGLQAQRTAKQAQLEAFRAEMIDVSRLREIARHYARGLDELTFAERQQLVQLFIRRVIATPTEYSAVCSFPERIVTGLVQGNLLTPVPTSRCWAPTMQPGSKPPSTSCNSLPPSSTPACAARRPWRPTLRQRQRRVSSFSRPCASSRSAR